MKIGENEIGLSSDPFIIAEVAQSHEGSLGQAMAFIDIAADCGASAVKFQTHIASEESTIHEPWRVKFSLQDSSRYSYWERMSFPKSWWRHLKERADERNLVFLSSPFSVKAVEWLDELDIPAWKLASGELDNAPLIARIEMTKKPVLISTGLSDLDKVRPLIDRFLSKDIEVALLHCTTMYPTPAEEVGMNILTDFMSDFGGAIRYGLSDHSGSEVPACVAAYLGASIFELHLTPHKKMFGPDVASSLDPEGFSRMVSGVQFASKMRLNSVNKKFQLADISKVKTMFSRSLVANRDLPAGHTLVEGDLGYKKPGGGLGYSEISNLLGKRLVKGLNQDSKIKLADVE